jgi:hypothetical protein
MFRRLGVDGDEAISRGFLQGDAEFHLRWVLMKWLSLLTPRLRAIRYRVLMYFYSQLGVGVVMAPIPIGLLIPRPKPVKIVVLAVILLEPHTVGLVLVLVPLVIVPISGVVVTPVVLLILPLVVTPLLIPPILG